MCVFIKISRISSNYRIQYQVQISLIYLFLYVSHFFFCTISVSFLPSLGIDIVKTFQLVW